MWAHAERREPSPPAWHKCHQRWYGQKFCLGWRSTQFPRSRRDVRPSLQHVGHFTLVVGKPRWCRVGCDHRTHVRLGWFLRRPRLALSVPWIVSTHCRAYGRLCRRCRRDVTDTLLAWLAVGCMSAVGPAVVPSSPPNALTR